MIGHLVAQCMASAFAVSAVIAGPTALPVTSKLPARVQAAVIYTVELPTEPRGQLAELWIPLPRDDAHQTVRRLRIDGRPKFTRDAENGNRFAYFRFTPASKMPLKVTVLIEVERTARSVSETTPNMQPQTTNDLARWLRPQERLPTGGQARTLSQSIIGDARDDFTKAHRIYEHVFAKMSYDKDEPGWGNADFDRACKIGKGNCTDFHGMFLALCRAQGIPARFEVGVEFAADGTRRVPGDYHCWAEFYTDRQGWVAVDISTAWKRAEAAKHAGRLDVADDEKTEGFGHHDAFRVAFSRGIDVDTVPAASKPVRFLIDPVLEIDQSLIPSGNPQKGAWRRTWSYLIKH